MSRAEHSSTFILKSKADEKSVTRMMIALSLCVDIACQGQISFPCLRNMAGRQLLRSVIAQTSITADEDEDNIKDDIRNISGRTHQSRTNHLNAQTPLEL